MSSQPVNGPDIYEKLIYLLTRWGPWRSGIVIVLLLTPLALAGDYLLYSLLADTVFGWDELLSVFLFSPLLIFATLLLFSWLINHLNQSRQRLSAAVAELDQLRCEDDRLKSRLSQQVKQLEQEIAQRQQAEQASERARAELELLLDKKEAIEQKLHEQGSLLRSILDTSPDLIYFRDLDGRFVACNRPLEQLTSLSEQEIIGRSPDEIYPEEVARSIIASDREVIEQECAMSYEQWMRCPDGSQTLYEFRKVPFHHDDGQLQGVLGFGRDITGHKKSADALRKANEQRLTFISTISHELRTPLNGIIGLSRMLRETALSEQQQSYVDSVHLSAVTLSSIFNDIVDLDKLERRRLDVVTRPVAMAGFWQDIANLGRLMADDRKLAFSLELDWPGSEPDGSGSAGCLELDETRLRQVLWNLLSNAVKFTSHGQVKLRVRQQALSEHRSALQIEVEDTGCGIPQQEQQKIFRLYYQGKKVASRYASGSGIGLSVSRQLVQAMGGEISVSSSPGSGSCFTVQLEARHCQPEETQRKAATAGAVDEQEPAEVVIPPLSILLVEDIELNVLVARALLEKLGHKVEVAMTGEQALQMARAAADGQRNSYDLMLLDIQLPDISGYEVARLLQAEQQTGSLPIVAFTANSKQSRQHYQAAGMVDVLAKPLDPEKLHQLLARYQQGFRIQEPESTMSQPTPYQDVLNIDMLEQYYDLVGPQALEKSITLFDDLMPGYMQILESNLAAADHDAVASEAHKIKGAASSVGLKRIQDIAQQAQTQSLANWEQDIGDWVAEIGRHYATDLVCLKQWLADKQG